MPGGACCAAQICCPPIKPGEASPAAKAALAAQLKNWLLQDVPLGAGTREDALAKHLAEQLLALWDLAPRGLAEAVMAHWDEPGSPAMADAIRTLYAPLFAEAEAG